MIFIGLLLRGLYRITLRLMLAALLFLAALKLISFGIALWAEHHPREVERLAERLFGMPVSVARIETGWRGFTPRIWLRGLVLGDEERLEVGDVLAALRLSDLLHWPESLPVVLRLTNTRLELERDAEGVTRIVGLPAARGGFAPPAVLLIENATVVWRDLKRNVHLVERGLDLQLVSLGGHRRHLRVRSRIRALELQAALSGRLTAGDWSARIHLEGQDLTLDEPINTYLPSSFRLDGARVDLRAWSRWEAGRHRGSRLQFHLPEARLAAEGRTPLTVTDLAGDLSYEIQDTGRWTLQLAGFKFRLGEAPLQTETALALRAVPDGLLLAARRLDLAAFSPLWRWLPGEMLPTALTAMAPRGVVHDALLHLGPGGWRLDGRIDDLAVNPWARVPGVEGLSGRIDLRPHQVQVALDSRDVQVDLRPLFRRPIELVRLHGALSWRRTETGWRLDAPALAAENADIRTLTRLHLSQDGAGPLHADIQSDFHDGDGRNARRYYPVGIMKPELVDWLDRAIVEGRVPEGRFLLYGPLNHFPFHETHDGHFEVTFRAEGLTLDYHPDWPALENAVGHVRFHNNGLEVALARARILDSRVENTQARIPALRPLAPLEISGTVVGPLADELRILRETPLRARLARHVEGIELEGRGRLTTELRIPFHGTGYRFRGALAFENARFRWPAQRLQLEALRGTLEIDEKGLHAQAIEGRMLGRKVHLTLRTEADRTHLTAHGRVPAHELVRLYPQLAPLGLEGETDARLELDLPNDTGATPKTVVLRVRSNLIGLALGLPPPLNKPAGEAMDLAFSLRLQAGRRHITLRLEDALSLTLDPAGGGQALTATLSRLPLRAWLRWFDTLPEGAGDGARLERIRLRTARLEAPPLLADDLALELERLGKGWQGEIRSNTLAGTLKLVPEGDRRRLHLDLERLHLTTSGKSAPPSSPGAEAAPDPRRLALLTVTARAFRFNQAELGTLRIHTVATSEGQRVTELSCRGGLASIQALGAWTAGKESTQTTRLKGTLDTEDMGRFLRRTLELDFLAGSKAHLSFDIGWPGPPHAFALSRLEGTMQLDMTAGRFLNIQPGAARILGLLNVRTLGRRLQFDFKDLYEEGLAFDTILGRFRLEEGQIYTNDLEISAPTSVIRIAGSTNLADRTHDQLITVSPRLDATLPVAGAIAGGPVTGLVVLLAQQALSDKLERIQSVRYSVTGSWDDPVVAPLNAPETVEQDPLDILDQ